MANSPQSLKRARQSEARRQLSRGMRTKLRTVVKRTRACASGDAETAKKAFIEMQSVADVAARKGLVHRRMVARLKKRINQSIRTAHIAAH